MMVGFMTFELQNWDQGIWICDILTYDVWTSFTGLYSSEQENMLLFSCSKAIESKPVKL